MQARACPSRQARGSGGSSARSRARKPASPSPSREPDAPVAALLARPAAQDRQPEHVAVEGLAAREVGALDREVVVGERHAGEGNPRRARRQRPRRGAGPRAGPVVDWRRRVRPPSPASASSSSRRTPTSPRSSAARSGGSAARVQGVATGRAALEALARAAPDAAVVEVPLSDVRGSELLAALGRARRPDRRGVRRLPRARAADELRGLGACDFFEKPFAVDALARGRRPAMGAPASVAEEEARDEVTGARPLAPRRGARTAISAVARVFALMDGPVAGAPAPRDGLLDAAPGRAARAARVRRTSAPPPPAGSSRTPPSRACSSPSTSGRRPARSRSCAAR